MAQQQTIRAGLVGCGDIVGLPSLYRLTSLFIQNRKALRGGRVELAGTFVEWESECGNADFSFFRAQIYLSDKKQSINTGEMLPKAAYRENVRS
jgi:hypothetical protein